MQANIVRQKSPFFPANTLIYKRKFRAVAVVPIHYGVVCRNPANRLFAPQNRITLLPPPKPADVYYFRDHLLSFQANDWRFTLCAAQHTTHAAGTKSCTKAPAGQGIKCRWPGPGCDSTLLNSHRSQKPEFRRQESVAQKFMMDFVNDFRDSDAGDTRKGVLMTSKSLSDNSVF